MVKRQKEKKSQTNFLTNFPSKWFLSNEMKSLEAEKLCTRRLLNGNYFYYIFFAFLLLFEYLLYWHTMEPIYWYCYSLKLKMMKKFILLPSILRVNLIVSRCGYLNFIFSILINSVHFIRAILLFSFPFMGDFCNEIVKVIDQ